MLRRQRRPRDVLINSEDRLANRPPVVASYCDCSTSSASRRYPLCFLERFMNRRQFLGTTAAAFASAPLSVSAPAQSASQDKASASKKSLPIGVFDPPFN